MTTSREADEFQAEVESLAEQLAGLAGSTAFDPRLPDDPARQPEREHFRGLAVTRMATLA